MGKKGIKLTNAQKEALTKIITFLRDDSKVFILKGYAGTGKTTLVKQILDDEFVRDNFIVSLLASTGRAAKILSDITNHEARTIHSEIYVYSDFNRDVSAFLKEMEEHEVEPDGQLCLDFVLCKEDESVFQQKKKTLFLIDESSMISNTEELGSTQAHFGSGRLLEDLLSVSSTAKYIFVGDPCQLPPIIDVISPALSQEYFKSVFDMDVSQYELTDIMRQKEDNDIILAAQNIRQLYDEAPVSKEVYSKNCWSKFLLSNYNNIHVHRTEEEMIDNYVGIIENKGFNAATLICRSNKDSFTLSNLIRQKLKFSIKLQEGDLLMVTQNNNLYGLLNGDMVVVKRITQEVIYCANLTFRRVDVEELVRGQVISVLLIEEILYSGRPNLSGIQQQSLFVDFITRMSKCGLKQTDLEFKNRMCTDERLNGLRCVFGYALTCHKAQGGEWNDVFLKIPRNLALNPIKETYQWLYTAITRTRNHLHICKDFYIG